MNDILVKYINQDTIGDNEYIDAVDHDNPVELIQMLKQVDSIKIEDEYYKYSFSDFHPATEYGFIDAVYIYLELLDI